MSAKLLRWAYLLRHHRVGEWGLDRWGVTSVWGASGIIVAQWLIRGQPALLAWHWLALALLILGGLGALILRGWAARHLYAVFEPQLASVAPPGQALQPEDKIAVRATGWFEVNSQTCLCADLIAYWRSYASREHAVLAIQHRTRFLAAGSPEEEIGMWYMFICPEAIEGIAPGHLRYGTCESLALRIIYRWQPPAAQGKRPPRPFNATAYLAFEDATAREQVWADLLADN